jgi:IclR family acetate operon transcriptional repressor
MTETGREVKTTEASLNILEAVHDSGGVTLQGLSDRLDLAKSTILNHLSTLEKNGYLVQEGGVYYVGLKFLYFGEHAKWQHPAFKIGRNLTHELAHNTNEEADFSVHEHGRVITLHHEIGRNNEPGRQIGQYFYMHSTAGGKAILSELPREEVESILDEWGMPQITTQTITDHETLFKELGAIQERGFSTNEEEHTEGYQSISKVAKSPRGKIIGALSVGAPTYRISLDELIDEDLHLLEAAVQQMEDSFT